MAAETRRAARIRRHRRIRQRVTGRPERPRLAVFRSLKHTYAQVIDDVAGHTLAASSSRESSAEGATKLERAADVGARLAKRAEELDISAVVFDRGGHRYHGRVKALADALRAGGIAL
ncbi:MAG: 50S ribosomal protein L18 [Chloroflexota bacterium]|nr:50S ribosomal protein L18 [Rhodospirillaceae bacterium]MDE2766899.1 50S ribosomal protein L18 [Chloroflexota bacterium]